MLQCVKWATNLNRPWLLQPGNPCRHWLTPHDCSLTAVEQCARCVFMAYNTTLIHPPDHTFMSSLVPQVLLDALAVPTALLHPSGTIQALNTAWREMTDTGALCGTAFPIGVDYPQLCAAHDVLGASELAQGIQAVLHGEAARFTRVYLARRGDVEHWYQLDVTPFPTATP